MKLPDMSARDALTLVDGLLRQLVQHPGMTGQDRAAIIQAGVSLSVPRRRHLGKWTPCNPASLPPRRPGQDYPRLPKDVQTGYLVSWEQSQEAGNAN